MGEGGLVYIQQDGDSMWITVRCCCCWIKYASDLITVTIQPFTSTATFFLLPTAPEGSDVRMFRQLFIAVMTTLGRLLPVIGSRVMFCNRDGRVRRRGCLALCVETILSHMFRCQCQL